MGATFDTGNMGVSALASSAVSRIINEFPGAPISFLDYSTDSASRTLIMESREVTIRRINMRFSKKLYLSNNIIVLLFLALAIRSIPWSRFRRWVIGQNSCLAEIDRTDLLLSLAGGDSFSDIYGLGRFFYVSLPQCLVLLMGKRLILLPQTIGPFRTNISKLVARYILRHSERVLVREQSSLRTVELLASPLQHGRYSFCYDLAFSLVASRPTHVEIIGFPPNESRERRPTVGVNVSGLLATGGYSGNNMFGLCIDYNQLTSSLIRFLIETCDVDVLLVPHVFETSDATASDRLESDQAACEKAFAEMKEHYPGRLAVLRGTYDQNEIKYLIGQCDFFVGSRMHACIAAVSQCVPAVCVAYSDKFWGVMGSLGIGSIVADARTQSVPEILDFIGESYLERNRTRQRLESKLPEVIATIQNVFGCSPNIPCGNATTATSDSEIPAGKRS